MPILLPPSTDYTDHLVCPDDHAYPGDNFRRFAALGNYIALHKPAIIVKLGDSWDMPSLSSYDKGKKSFVFKNVKDDIESGHEAEEILFSPMLKLNKELARQKKKQYSPLIIKIRGNHEDRVARLLEYEPRWEESVSMDSFNNRLGLDEIVVPYQDFISVDGIYYSHFWASGVMNRPISSAKALCTKKGVSATMGHSHVLDHASFTKPNGEMIRGLIAGCFLDPETNGFGGPQVDRMYWSGIIHKRNVLNGDYELNELKTESLIREYL